MAANHAVSRKIQNNGPKLQQRASWGIAGQSGGSRPSRHGAAPARQQRPTGVVRAGIKTPSLADQAAAAMRHKRLDNYTTAQQSVIVDAYALLRENAGTSTLDPLLAEALASPVIQAQLDARMRQLEQDAAEAANSVLPARAELSEQSYVMLHVQPSVAQDPALTETLRQRLAAGTPQTAWLPSHQKAAAQARESVNEQILSELCVPDDDTACTKVMALGAALTGCIVYGNDDSISDWPMRCKCELAVLTASNLLQPDQKLVKVQLPCGLKLDVTRQADPWQPVEVLMTGVSPDISLGFASYMVADLLKHTGAPFTLSPCSQTKSLLGDQPSGRKQLGIRVVAPPAAPLSSSRQVTRQGHRNLLLTTRSDVINQIPPVVPVLVVQPGTDGHGSRTFMTWIRFKVDAKDGHTDASRCNACGHVGHYATRCTAALDGVVARYSYFSTVPAVQPAVNTTVATASRQQMSNTGGSRQQQQPRQQLQPLPSVNGDGFTAATGNRRNNNQQLNKQVTSNAKQTAVSTSVMRGSTTSSITVAEPPVPAQDDMSDADALADYVWREPKQMEQMEQGLMTAKAALAHNLNENELVKVGHSDAFEKLMSGIATSITTIIAARARAAKALAILGATPAPVPPKGIAKDAGRTAQQAYQLQRRTYAVQQDRAESDRIEADDAVKRLYMLKCDYQAFEEQLQQYYTKTGPVLAQLQRELVTLTLKHALCTDSDDGTVLSHQGELFAELVSETATAMGVLATAQTQAAEALATAEMDKATVAEQEACGVQQALSTDQLAKANCQLSSLHALARQYQAFNDRLQLCNNLWQETKAAELTLTSLDSAPQSPAGDSGDSQMSPVIQVPSPSQESPADVHAGPAVAPQNTHDAFNAVADVVAGALEVGRPVSAIANTSVTTTSAATVHEPEHHHSQATDGSTHAQRTEQHRNELVTSRLDQFDAAEQQGVNVEQQRHSRNNAHAEGPQAEAPEPLVLHNNSSSSAKLGESDTELGSVHSDDSFNSGPSESSESDCSDAGKSKRDAASKRRTADTVIAQPQQLQQQQQQQQQESSPRRRTRADTARRARTAATTVAVVAASAEPAAPAVSN